MTSFEDPELLREALEEVAAADVGEYVEEPWGSQALAAAELVAAGTNAELRELAREALRRVAAASELRDLGQADARIAAAWARLREADAP